MYVVGFMRYCYGRYDPIEEPHNYCKLIFDLAFRARLRYGRELCVYELIDQCEMMDRVDYASIYDMIMTRLFLHDDITQWGEKTQLVWTKIPSFVQMFPNPKVIHVIRDPRSVLASFKNFTYSPAPAYLGAIFNCFGSMKHGLLYKENIPKKRYKVLKYEDLATRPVETLEETFSFLELSANHELLDQTGWRDAKGDKWTHNSAFHDTDESFEATSALVRWRDQLTDWEIGLCEFINRDMMLAYGYQIETKQQNFDFLKALEVIHDDDRLTTYLKLWLTERSGVEEFPNDPLSFKNWSENAFN